MTHHDVIIFEKLKLKKNQKTNNCKKNFEIPLNPAKDMNIARFTCLRFAPPYGKSGVEKFLLKLESANRSWKKQAKLKRTEWSWEVSPRLENLAAVGNFWLKLERVVVVLPRSTRTNLLYQNLNLLFQLRPHNYSGGCNETVSKIVQRNWCDCFVFFNRNRCNCYIFLIGPNVTVTLSERVLL